MNTTKQEDELKRLNFAFSNLNNSTDTLVESYRDLKRETVELGKNLEESRHFLTDTLDSLNCAVVVTDNDGNIIHENRKTHDEGIVNHHMVKKWISLANERFGDKRKIEWDMDDGTKLAITVSPLYRSSAKNRGGYVISIDDVTEIVRLRKQSNRADRLSAIGKVAAGMAHEIRNPLGGMEIFASLLRREMENDEDKRKMVDHISRGIRSINNVVSNFLLFTAEPTPQRRNFSLSGLLKESMEFAQYVFEKENVSAGYSMPDEEITAFLDPELVRQVLLNLIHNSVQAMPEGGSLHLTICKIIKHNNISVAHIKCEDSGTGIAQNLKDKVFDPFFTTKEAGTGLGLAIVSQIAQAHGGFIDHIDSKLGGAGFIIELPLEV